MRNMQGIISLAAAVLVLAAALAGCVQSDAGKDYTDTGDTDKGDKLSVVATIFPEYDWVMNILGDKAGDADVTMLLGSGVDLHSYQPTVDDIIKISACDVFIYVGGESDGWVEDALKEAVNKDMIVVNMLESLGDAVREKEAVEGMEKEAEEEGEVQEGPEYDEHVWLSLKNAAILCDVIKDALVKADAGNAKTYASNAAAYIERLKNLDAGYQAAVDAAGRNTLLFCDRFPFRYLMDDYGLSYYAAFAGCSAETEASFETVTFLAGKVDELGLSCVLTLEGADHKIAETVVAATAAKSARILSMDSMQSTTSEDVKSNVSYLSIMEKNLEVLKEALE